MTKRVAMREFVWSELPRVSQTIGGVTVTGWKIAITDPPVTVTHVEFDQLANKLVVFGEFVVGTAPVVQEWAIFGTMDVIPDALIHVRTVRGDGGTALHLYKVP